MTKKTPSRDTILAHKNGEFMVITLNRPDARNAIDDGMRADLIAAFHDADTDQSVRAIVLTGAGSAFCSGGDVSGMRQRLEAPQSEVAFNGWRRQKHTHSAVAAIHRASKPVLAAINGPAVGLGLDMALACDFLISADTAKFSMSFIKRGLVSDGGGLYFLPRRVGIAKAKDLIFSGRVLQADEALEIGLVDRLTGADALMTEALSWAEEVSQGSATAMALVKGILDQSLESDLETILSKGRMAQAICYSTTDHRRSVEEFLARSERGKKP